MSKKAILDALWHLQRAVVQEVCEVVETGRHCTYCRARIVEHDHTKESSTERKDEVLPKSESTFLGVHSVVFDLEIGKIVSRRKLSEGPHYPYIEDRCVKFYVDERVDVVAVYSTPGFTEVPAYDIVLRVPKARLDPKKRS